MISALLIVAAALAGAPAPVGAPASSTTVTQVVVNKSLEDDGDKVVCKSTTQTGTHFSSKTCHTKHDWLAQQQSGKALVDEFQQRSSSMSRNTGP
jgi:hypothetical protein